MAFLCHNDLTQYVVPSLFHAMCLFFNWKNKTLIEKASPSGTDVLGNIFQTLELLSTSIAIRFDILNSSPKARGIFLRIVAVIKMFTAFSCQIDVGNQLVTSRVCGEAGTDVEGTISGNRWSSRQPSSVGSSIVLSGMLTCQLSSFSGGTTCWFFIPSYLLIL